MKMLLLLMFHIINVASLQSLETAISKGFVEITGSNRAGYFIYLATYMLYGHLTKLSSRYS